MTIHGLPPILALVILPKVSTPSDERAVQALFASIAVLAAASIFFLIVSIALWVKNRIDAERLAGQKAKWSAKLFDCVSGAAAPGDFGAIVSKSEVSGLMDFLIEYAARLRGEELKVLCAIAAPYLGGIARSYGRGDRYQRAWTTRVLGTFGWPASRPYLIKSIMHPSPHVAMTAFRCLIAQGDQKSFEILVWSLKRFEKWNRNLLALLIASVGKNSPAPIRRGFADAAQPDFVRVILCTALREMSDVPAADIAAKILEAPAGVDLTIACVRLIRGLGTWKHVDVVRKQAASTVDSIRAQAIRALGRLGNQSDLPVLKDGLNDPSSWVALHSANAIRDLGMEPLLQDLARSSHPRAVLAQQVLAKT